MRTPEVLIVGGALVMVPLGMGGIPLIKLLFFALAVLCGTGLHSLARKIRTVSVCAPCSPVPHCIALRLGRMVQGLLLTFFAVVFLSPLWSSAPMLSMVGVEPRFEGVMTYAVFFGLALLAGSMVRMGRERDLLLVILWSNVGVVFYGLLQLVRMDPFGGWWDADVFLGRVFSSLGQPNFLGQFLLLTGPLAILAAWQWRENPLSHRERARARGCPRAAIALVIGNIIVLFATGSRAAVLGLGVSFLVYMWCFAHSLSRGERAGRGVDRNFRGNGSPYTPLPNPPPKGEGNNRYSVGEHHPLFGIAMVLSIAVLCGAIFLHRFTLPGEWDRSIGSRVAIWRDAVSMIRARPIGWGLETTGLLFPRFQHAPLTAYESLTASIDRAHSKPLDLLLTVGPLGLVTYYAFLVLLMSGCIRAWRRDQDSSALVGALGLIGVSVSLLFGFEGIVVHAFFWLICGMLTTLTLPSPFKGRGCCRMTGESRGCAIKFPPPFKGEGKGEGFNESPLWICGLVSTLCILLFGIVIMTALWLSAHIAMGRAERAFQRGYFVAAVQGYALAVQRAPWDQAILVRFLETALLAREQAENRETEQVLDVALEKRFRSLWWLTHDRDPLLPSLQAWHAALRQEKENALTFLEEAKHRAPFGIPRLRMAAKVAEILDDPGMLEDVRMELRPLLPPWWNDARDTRNRILWKENPWLPTILF